VTKLLLIKNNNLLSIFLQNNAISFTSLRGAALAATKQSKSNEFGLAISYVILKFIKKLVTNYE
jgi:hypothetical protein